jgi:hypothetical protein
MGSFRVKTAVGARIEGPGGTVSSYDCEMVASCGIVRQLVPAAEVLACS